MVFKDLYFCIHPSSVQFTLVLCSIIGTELSAAAGEYYFRCDNDNCAIIENFKQMEKIKKNL